MKNAVLLFCLIFVLCANSLSAEEAASDNGKDEEKEKITSLNEDRRDVLKYGIDSEIINLLSILKEEGNKNLSAEAAVIYGETTNPDIMKAAVDYFISIDYSDARPSAEKILSNWEDENYNTLSSALRYVSEYPAPDSEELISKLLNHENKSLASAALSAIGKCGTEKSSDLLLDYLDDDDYPEELKPSLIKALGEMKSLNAVDTLIEILDDVDEEKSWRWTACEALGKIGHPDAMAAIQNALLDKDTYLRSYAIKALAGFEEEGVEDTLIQALRDSFWRVRVSAAEALGERESTNAIDILIYKVKKDPENNVKKAALQAIGKIGGKVAFDFLRELYIKPTTNQAMRTGAVEILVDKDLSSSIESIKTVLAEEWEKDTSPVLSYTCKFLSKAENSQLKDFFTKMLDHNDIAIKIYGIRGIELNRFGEQKERIEALTKEGINNAVRKAALSALENL